ncbi:hypothetical protein [Pseudoxanthomonas wuyuanensis]|nr:hypothetical protein [Pseudoxanthomonas wuyuanensis]
MRKLKPVELVVLTAAMSIGSLSEAQEIEELPITNLNTVSVTGTHYYWPITQVSYQQGPPVSLYPGGTPLPATPNSIVRAKALNCAQKYGVWPLPGGYTLSYMNKYGWTQGTGITTYTSTNVQPFGSWTSIAGLQESNNKQIWILPEGYATFKEHLITLVHELAHAGGITNESIAEQAGQSAYAAFVADNGAKCGGL